MYIQNQNSHHILSMLIATKYENEVIIGTPHIRVLSSKTDYWVKFPRMATLLSSPLPQQKQSFFTYQIAWTQLCLILKKAHLYAYMFHNYFMRENQETDFVSLNFLCEQTLLK